MSRIFAALITAGTLVGAAQAQSINVQTLTSSDPALAWKTLDLPNGKKAEYTLGVGSGAFRHKDDPANTFWAVGDRGPNMTCAEGKPLLGNAPAAECAKRVNGRIYPTPDYTPSIYRISLDRAAGSFKLLETIPLRKAKSGANVSGLLNPQTIATKDSGVDLQGRDLPDNADNIDLEAIVRLTDGSFWVADEMGPSIAHVSRDGRIIKRFVPADAAKDYAGAEAEIVATLPAILSKRQGNRGFESIAISPDETHLYFIMQNPLANPDAKTFQSARNSRLFKMERATGRLVGEYVYQLENPSSFGFDPTTRQSDPRISELMAIGADKLIVLERTEKTTKLFEINLAGATNILGSQWDNVATSPSLEQLPDAPGVTPLAKTLRFDTFRDAKDAPEKIEGLAILEDGSLMLINDNDFGIRGDDTKVLIVKGAIQADPAIWKK
jgi:hypothetical protein